MNNHTNTTYKQTEIGLIPINWEVKKLGEVALIKGDYGINAAAVDFDEKLPAYIRITDIDDDGYFTKDKKKSVDDINSNNFFLEENDLVFVRTGATVGKSYLYNENDGKLVFAGFLIRFRIDTSKANPYYIWTFTKTKPYWDWVNMVSMRSGQPGINSNEYSTFKLPIPPLHEQQKIATILSTWDAAIDNCKTIIENIKQRNKGLAQQLLTGKIRVKGFEKTKWMRLNADEVFVNHSQKNNAENEVLLSATQDRGMIPRDMLEGRVTMPTGETNSYKLVDKGDFVISLRSFQGGLEYSEYRGLVSPAYTVLKPIKPINDIFYKFYFKSYNFIGHLSVAVIGIRDGKNISYENFATIIIPNPPIEEQNAIEKILSKADAELIQYQQKLLALQQQKKGLMQQLLTGKTRVKID